MTAGWGLPESVELGGRDYAIHADFRDVLEIIRWLNDPDQPEQTRLYVALALFYDGFEAMPASCWDEAARQLMRFINGGEEEAAEAPAPKLLDWEQDQRMIVADINKVAGCEVRALPFVHWWTFLAWFGGIGEGQLSTVVSLRDKLRRGKKLEDWEREYYRQHKATVELKRRYSADELAEQERLKKLLGE